MNRNLLLLLILAAVILLLLRSAKAKDPSAPQVTTGAYGTQIDYDNAQGRGCCG